MNFISSDTNVWLDFNAISQTELPFRLPYTYIMYKEALQNEIITPSELLNDLINKGLLGVEITTEEFFYAIDLSSKYPKLSGYDKIALAIAKIRKIPLLTGDNPLRKAAIKENVEVFGTIGLLDKLYFSQYITKDEYRYCIENLIKQKERRLPIDELKKRLYSIT